MVVAIPHLGSQMELFEKIVCSITCDTHILNTCMDCPGIKALTLFIFGSQDLEFTEKVIYKWWVTTD
jgi:hypothetical protein